MKKLNILIPNATSPKNIGDLAMLESLIRLLGENRRIAVHSVNHLQHRLTDIKIRQTIYDWAVFSTKNPLIRFYRMVCLIFSVFLFPFTPKQILPKKLYMLLVDYKNAEMICIVGGGYLRSRKGVKQSLNLLMNLLPFYLASKTYAKTVVCPISVGPFAYTWQKSLTSLLLREMDFLSVREAISQKILKSEGVKAQVFSDHAFFQNTVAKNRSGITTIGFTLRNWGNKASQDSFEKAFIQACSGISQGKKYKFQPILQVDAAEFGETDKLVTQRVVRMLKKMKIRVLPIKKVNSLSDALDVYRSVDCLIGMRMHSNILAATQIVPFIAIAYEHKTHGIAKKLGMSRFVVDSDSITPQKILRRFHLISSNYLAIREKLKKNIRLIQDDQDMWRSILLNA